MIYQLNALVDLLCHQAHVLFRGLAAVCPGGGDNQHVLIPDAGGFQFRDQHRDIGFRRLPAAGDIGDDNAHLIPGLYQLLQRCRVHRMIQSPADVLCRCPLRKFHPIGFQLCCNQLLRQVDLKFFCSAFHRFNHHDDSFLSKGFSYGESFIESIPYSQEKVDVNLVKKCTCLHNRTSTMLAGLPTGESPEFMSHSMRFQELTRESVGTGKLIREFTEISCKNFD